MQSHKKFLHHLLKFLSNCLLALLVLIFTTIYSSWGKVYNKAHFRTLPSRTITLNHITVIKDIDGDTITVQDLKHCIFKVRFLNINATEISPYPQPYAIAAAQLVKQLIPVGSQIILQYDSKNKIDKYGRLLANIYRQKDNLWINAELIKRGLAYVYILSNSKLGLKQLINLEDTAIKAKVNLWSLASYLPIHASQSNQYINEYKIIDGEVTGYYRSKKNLWLLLNQPIKPKPIGLTPHDFKQLYTALLAIEIKNKRTSKHWISYSNSKQFLWQRLIHKKIRVRGYIDKSSGEFCPYIKLLNPLTIEITSFN